ncbi:hypothetical protein HPB51_001874 [Rhipicephalus microplus]|uniref:Hexosyltransferase n=1 Tax=Rhipicephalus microplus TaxID=6941 RepID=A0A9J6EEU6_RHIMP|nr:hypothetical protein HPB51_001874 [Rhipicephalus microplus]
MTALLWPTELALRHLLTPTRALASGAPSSDSCDRRLAVRRLKYAVFGTWTLVAFFAVNYAVMRVCVSDMGWHVEQRDVIPRVVGTRGFPMLPRVACPRYLAVVVCSAVDNFEHRAAIRVTWGRDVSADKGTAVFFLVGKPGDTPKGQYVQSRLNNESALHKDLIQADFRDTYRNLTVKSVFMLKWAYVKCSRTRFLLKADDDMFVNVEKLMRFLKAYGENRTRPFLAGYVAQGRKTVRRAGSKWYMPLAVYEPDWLPSYIHGSGYVVSRDAVRPLFTEALATSFLYVEDIFLTGVVAQKMACGRRVQQFVRRVVVFIWSLLAVCVLNYAVLRHCVSDMRWHVRQRDQTRIVVGPGRFRALPQLRCPDFLAVVVCSAVDHFEQRAAVRDTWARDAASGRSGVFFLIGFADNTVGALSQCRLGLSHT